MTASVISLGFRPDTGISQAERSISAKLFAIITAQGKTAAATALFNNKQQVAALALVPWSDIDWYANHHARASISSMYSLRGFPVREEVEALEQWVATTVKTAGARKLLSSITGMQHGCGMPDLSELTKLKEWCVEAAPNEWQRLLSSITGMQAGCGMPDLSQLTKP